MRQNVWSEVEKRYTIPDDPITGRVDMVIGLGTDVSRNGKYPSLQSAVIVRKAAKLAGLTRAPRLLFSGGYHHPAHPDKTEAHLMASLFLATLMIPGRCLKLLVETKSWRTYQQADNLLKILQELGCRHVIIVAQQWHARRVRATFRKRWRGSGITFSVVKAESPYGPFGSQRRFNHFLLFAAWDTVGLVLSKLKGYC